MQKLDDYEIAASYKGKFFDEEKMNEAAEENGDGEYEACCLEYDDEQLELFGITPTLLDKWMCGGVDFRVFIEVKDGKITDCSIYKFKETSCYGKSEGYWLVPTQQEIRIFRRIMDHVTK